MERRNLVGGGLAAGLTALVTPANGEAAAAAADDGDARVARAIGDLRSSLDSRLSALQSGGWSGIELIRKQQHEWLKSSQKYPDFIEIGLAVWDSVHDWHVRYQQPLTMTRMADGRYSMAFMFTTLILRTDQAPDYVSYPYEANERRR